MNTRNEKNEVDQLAEIIKREMSKQETATEAGGVKETFCSSWPQVKPALTALRSLLAFVPGVGVIAGPAISIVISAGDAAHSALCTS